MKTMSRLGAQPSLPSLLLCCHTDVVPANESLWTQPAFHGTLVDGKIFGRGAQDMKSVGVQVNQQSASCMTSPKLGPQTVPCVHESKFVSFTCPCVVYTTRVSNTL